MGEKLMNIPAVAALNQVDGFNPMSFMREIGDENEKTLYLDVLYRKLWFRLAHPDGKIVKKILKLDDKCAAVEARVYLNRTDEGENFLSNAVSLRYYSPEGFGPKYLETAETAATGRALADAGFGVQFADICNEYDPDQIDAGIPVNNATTMDDTKEKKANVGLESSFAMETGASTSDLTTDPQKPSYTMDMNVDEIKKLMTLEQAMQTKVSAGTFRGKTLKCAISEKTSCLQWFVNGYRGPDNILRAAAQLLLESASKATNTAAG